jgi:hypothetical protein
MNCGVSTVPWGVFNHPSRARPMAAGRDWKVMGGGTGRG